MNVDLRPPRAVPVKNQGLGTSLLVVAHRPDVLGRDGVHAGERIVDRARVRGLDLRPPRAVPVKGQRVADLSLISVDTHRPCVGGRDGTHASECVERGARVRVFTCDQLRRSSERSRFSRTLVAKPRESPTAHASVGETALTAWSSFDPEPGFGPMTLDQPVPSQ